MISKKDKKVILINTSMPSDVDLNPLTPHLGLLALGTYIKNSNFQPILFDSRKYITSDFWQELKPLLDDALCVCLSVMTAQVNSGIEISKKIRESFPNIPIIWGGFHPSLFPEQTLKDSLVDFVIQGEGDWSFLDLLNELSSDLKNFEKIDGLGYKKDGKIIFNPQEKFHDINELPNWDWSLTDVDSFLEIGTWSDPTKIKQLSIQTSRGCPFMCTFCINTTLKCYRKWRTRDVDKVVDEIEHLIKEYNIEWINFRDEIFFLTKERIINFCNEIIKRGIKVRWWCNSRVNFFTCGVIDDEVMSKLKESGCVNLSFGVESGSPRILQLLRKGITPNQVIKSAQVCNKYGIKPIYSFIAGLPSETKEDLMLTYKLMKDIINNCPSAMLLGPHLYRPYPGCELYEIAKKFGVPEAKELREWPRITDESFNESSDPIEKGAHTFDGLPWVYDQNFVKAFITYARYASYNPLILFRTKRYFMGIQSAIAKLRFSTNFFRFIGIERKIKDSFRNMLHYLN